MSYQKYKNETAFNQIDTLKAGLSIFYSKVSTNSFGNKLLN